MERPIGYWLKHLDRLIEAAAERAFAEQKLTRRHWQIMNLLRQSPQDAAGLTEAIRPFWGPGAITLDEVTSELARRGWLTQDNTGRYALTPAAQAGHAAVGKRIQGVRSASLAGLSEEDYNATVQVLQRMTENLEREGRLVSSADSLGKPDVRQSMARRATPIRAQPGDRQDVGSTDALSQRT